jgi:hypothetical protein
MGLRSYGVPRFSDDGGGRHGLGVGDKRDVAATVVRQWVFLPLRAFGTSDL